jgi:hypothetical protein
MNWMNRSHDYLVQNNDTYMTRNIFTIPLTPHLFFIYLLDLTQLHI